MGGEGSTKSRLQGDFLKFRQSLAKGDTEGAMLESVSVDEQTLSVIEHSEGDALDDDDDASALTSTSTASLDDSLLELVTELAAVMGGASAAKAQAALDDALRAQRHRL